MDQQIPEQTCSEKVKVADIVYVPPSPYAHTHAIRIRIYDVCPEHGAHTDPDLQQWGYAEHGI